VHRIILHANMIRTFKHRGLERFFKTGDHRGIIAKSEARIERLLDRLDSAVKPEDMNIPGFRFHSLTGNRKGSYSITVTGNWRITFRFDGEDAIDLNLEDYH
jgi:proteic killer suppression protein